MSAVSVATCGDCDLVTPRTKTLGSGLRSSNLLSCWFVAMELFAAETDTDSWVVLQSAKDGAIIILCSYTACCLLHSVKHTVTVTVLLLGAICSMHTA